MRRIVLVAAIVGLSLAILTAAQLSGHGGRDIAVAATATPTPPPPGGSPPIAHNGSANATSGYTIQISLEGHDVDFCGGGQVHSITNVSYDPSHGELANQSFPSSCQGQPANGYALLGTTFDYTPEVGFVGDEPITFAYRDGFSTGPIATFIVHVVAGNTPTPTPPQTPTPTPSPTPLPGSPTPCPTVSPTNCDVAFTPPSSPTATPTMQPTSTPVSSATPAATCPGGFVPSWPVPVGDADCDGFPSSDMASGNAPESYIATDMASRCASTVAPDDEAGQDDWPVDFNDNKIVNGQDAGKFSSAYGKAVGEGPFGSPPLPGTRFDFSGNGVINGQDVGKFATFYGKSCA